LGAVLSNATAVFLIFPVVIWLFVLFAEHREFRFLIAALLITVLSILACLFFLSIRGSYAGDYQPGQLFARWHYAGRRFNTPLIFAMVTTLGIFARWVSFELLRQGSRLCFLLVWHSFLLAFLFFMLPRKFVINYYLIVPGGMFWTGCKVMICFFLVEIYL